MSSTPPQRTDEERAKGVALALEARQARAQIKDNVTSGAVTVQRVLADGAYGHTDELGQHARIAGRIEVGDLLLSVHGVGPVHAAEILAEAGVEDADERLDRLNGRQREAIVAALEARGLS
jgi:hypothetical protein